MRFYATVGLVCALSACAMDDASSKMTKRPDSNTTTGETIAPVQEEMAAPVKAQTWACDAKNIADYTYDGGSTARVRLRQYSSGDVYPVKKQPDGSVVGKTGDGTEFTCVASA